MRKLLIIGILVASVVGVIAMTSMRPEPPKKERVELDPLVDVQVLESMNAKFEIRSQGIVRPRTETILSAEVSGTITSISPKFVGRMRSLASRTRTAGVATAMTFRLVLSCRRRSKAPSLKMSCGFHAQLCVVPTRLSL